MYFGAGKSLKEGFEIVEMSVEIIFRPAMHWRQRPISTPMERSRE